MSPLPRQRLSMRGRALTAKEIEVMDRAKKVRAELKANFAGAVNRNVKTLTPEARKRFALERSARVKIERIIKATNPSNQWMTRFALEGLFKSAAKKEYAAEELALIPKAFGKDSKALTGFFWVKGVRKGNLVDYEARNEHAVKLFVKARGNSAILLEPIIYRAVRQEALNQETRESHHAHEEHRRKEVEAARNIHQERVAGVSGGYRIPSNSGREPLRHQIGMDTTLSERLDVRAGIIRGRIQKEVNSEFSGLMQKHNDNFIRSFIELGERHGISVMNIRL